MQRSSSWRWRAVGALGLVVAATGGGLTASVSPVAGEGPVQQLEDIGLLRLGLSSTGGTVAFVPAGSTTPTSSQPVTVTGKCAAASSGPLASIAAAGGNQGLGLVTGGLGVRQKNTCSSAEGRVGGTEQITVALGAAFDDDVFVTAVELDVEGKFDADLAVSLDGAPPLARALLNSSDNGPDAGISDNDRVLVSTAQPDVHPFRSLTLSAAGGEIALEGGGDASYARYLSEGKVGPLGTSSSTADTILRLVRIRDFADDLSCDETRTAAVIGGSADAATINRLDNLEGAETCEDVGVTFEITDDGVLLDKGTTGLDSGAPQAVHAIVDIVWTAQAAAVPLPAREINFDPADPAGWEVVQWCTSWDPVTQTAVHPPDADFPGGVLPWCLVDEHVELQGDGTVVQVQRYDGAGDPMWR